MSVKAYWDNLSGAGKLGLSVGTIAVAVAIVGGAYWALRSDYQTVLSSGNPEKVATVIREAEKLKIPYKISADGAEVSVPKADVGKLRVSIVGAGSGGGGAVGFELFNNTDFSTTEFTQKINYQRALQGELARTISGIAGVASARVHLVMPESGFLRRQTVKPTAAVTLNMEPGAQLSASQVHGIQKLVAASVADIKLDDISVLDQEGVALTQSKTGLDDSANRARLDAKKEIDSYLEAKLKRVLMNIDPEGQYGVSVDSTLTQDDIKVTTEDLLPVDSTGLGLKTSGVLVRERQTSKRDASSADASNGNGSSVQPSSNTKEAEYKVGRRVEQVATAPGAIERVSVAVVAHMNAGQAGEQEVRNLIFNAIGASEARGDTISLVLLAPSLHGEQREVIPQSLPSHPLDQPSDKLSSHQHGGVSVAKALIWILAFVGFVLLAWIAVRRSKIDKASEPSNEEVDAIVAKVNAWLDQEVSHAR